MFICLSNCLLSFKHFLNMFCASFGMDIFFYISWRGNHTRPFCFHPLCPTSVLLHVDKSLDHLAWGKECWLSSNSTMGTITFDVRLLGIYPIIILLTIDFDKAFDSINCNFIDNALGLFNIGSHVRKWVKIIIASQYSAV